MTSSAERHILRRRGPSAELERAASFTTESWFPVTPSVLELVQDGLASGRYLESRDLLIADLSKDFALFMYCVRRLATFARLRPGSLLENVDPAELLTESPLDDFAAVLGQSAAIISAHRIESATDAQAQRMVAAVTSACVTKALAQKSDISGNLAFATALFRQLGLTLIAWNYPHVYARVLSQCGPDEDLDELLDHQLGFSPSMLGITVAREWGISSVVRTAMGDELAKQDSAPAAELGARLESLCRVGETLAQVRRGDQETRHSTNWELASQEVRRLLGNRGFERLAATIREQLRTYFDAAPTLFVIPDNVGERVEDHDGPVKKHAHNRYLSACPAEIRAELEALYEEIRADRVRRTSLEYLTKDLFIKAGFSRGCIYLLDPVSALLKPRLAIGPVLITALTPVPYAAYTHRHHPVALAFKTSIPISGTESIFDGSPVYSFLGSLGVNHRNGVLVLESKDELPGGSPHLALFKALRQALSDCLGLE